MLILCWDMLILSLAHAAWAGQEAFHKNVVAPKLGDLGSGVGGLNQPCDTQFWAHDCLGTYQCDPSNHCVPANEASNEAGDFFTIG